MYFITLLVAIIFTLVMAGKDADSYLLKDNSATGPLVDARIQRWHRDGYILYVIFSLILAYAFKDIWILLQAAFVRLSIFNLGFNYWGGLNITYIGTTAWTDKISSKIFGANGAVKEAITALILTIALTVYLTWFK